jgi:ribosomal protein S18 acetylase RimI-like enzyme
MAAPAGGAPEPEPDPVLRPYAELEDYGSLYVSGLAVHAPFRGRGIGCALLAAAEARATALGLARVSLICFEANAGAMRLYRRLGFQEIARRRIVPHPMLHFADGDALLLARTIVRPAAQTAPRPVQDTARAVQSATRAA